MMKTKKVVFFIVEGQTDIDSLQQLFRKIYKGQSILFRFTHGDITSDTNISTETINDIIYGYVKETLDEYGYYKNDIWQIIQVFDMDGAYIDDSCIFEDKEKDVFYYQDNGIFYKSKQSVIERNQHKRELMDYLVDNVSDIEGIPYYTFFMSTDLDHAIHGLRNLSVEEKIKYADKFYDTYKNNTDGFIRLLKNDICPKQNHKTWKYIRERNLNSLSRCTNLGKYFNHNPIGYD